LLTRRRIAYEMLLVKRGLLGPDATLKATSVAAAAKTSPTAPPPAPKAGLSALIKAGADQTAVDNVVKEIEEIIKVVEKSTFNEMKPLVAELRGKVRQLEDKCGIVIELPEAKAPGASPESLLTNPLDLPAGVPGLDLPAVPAEAPAAGPAGKAAADQAPPPAPPPPAAAQGAVPPAAPAAPDAAKPAPAGQGAAPPAGQPPAAPPAAGGAPKA
jgi:hypothetical protein